MASIHREITIAAKPEELWAALRDVGAVHERLAPGFVTDVQMEEGARVVTFGNGVQARELIVDVDDEKRRVAWSVVGSPAMTHHNASAQVFPDGDGTRFVWIADLLPNEAAPRIAGMIEAGLGAIRAHFEKPAR
jgi:carbon monoxide dehydrogenase subunit G